MKYAYLIRHGKSSWKYPDLSDRDRPLKKRGRRDGLIMGQALKKAGIVPDLIISSPANRAFSAAAIIAKQLGYEQDCIVKENALYFSGVQSILNVIQNVNDKFDTIFVFGHNPDFTSLANEFSEQFIDNLPTTGVAGIEFDIQNWKDASTNNGKMILLDFPGRHR